jgi:eukaryotic-like serine/threonine-protein kinase
MARKAFGPARLARAFDAGEPIDWVACEAEQADDSRREHVRQLRLLAQILAAHREWSGTPPSDPGRENVMSGLRAQGAPVTWGHLTIRERIGRGAFGEVFRAWDPRLEREVALKLLTKARPEPSNLSSSAIAEGRLLARVRHPNVAAVYGAEQIDGTAGIWMELVRGQTLDALLRQRGTLGATEAVAIGVDLCHAMSAVHQAGLLHRDVKARNVMREDGGRIVLMDFGAGRDLQPAADALTSDLAGTLNYLAPEVLEGGAATCQSDVYSLGVLLFRLVTSQYPVVGRTVDAVRRGHAEGRRQWLADLRPDLPEQFTRTVESAMASDPTRRFQSAGELAAGLTGVLTRERHPPRSADSALGAASQSMGRRPSRLKMLAVSVVALAVLGGVTWRGRRVPSNEEDPTRMAAARVAPSVAVLPFVNVAGDDDQAYLADGITDALIGRLSRTTDLKVISRGSTLRLSGDRASAAEVGGRLYVGSIVEGSVRRSGNLVHVDARLIDTATARAMWAQTYQRSMTDIVGLELEMADAIARQLGVRDGTADGSRGQLQSATSPAYEEYLKGRWHWNKRNAAGFKSALQHFNLAIGADPLYAPAHAGLADTYSHLGMFGLMPAREAIPRARAAGARALQLDPTLFELWASLAFLDLYEWNWQAAERGFKQALALNPRYATAHHWYALHLVSLGRYEEAERAIQRAMEIDPLSLIIANDAGVIRLFKRDFAGAEQQVQRVLDIDPHFAEALSRRGWARVGAGRPAQAIADFEHLLGVERDNAFWSGSLAYAYAAAGRRAEAQRLVDRLEERAAREYMPPLAMVMAYAGLRDNARAFAWMEKAYLERSDWLTGLLHPAWDPIRPDARYADMMRRVGYPSEVMPVSSGTSVRP